MPAKVRHPACSEKNGKRLHKIEPLPQEQKRQKNAYQGIEKIAQTCLHDLTRYNSVDEERPVNAEKARGTDEHRKASAIPQNGAHFVQLPEDYNEDREKKQRPHYPMAHDFQWRRLREGFPMQGEQPPAGVGKKGVNEPG